MTEESSLSYAYRQVMLNAKTKARSWRPIEPDYRPCKWGCGVWNIGRDECPPHLRSNKEIALAQEEAKRTA